MFDENRKIGRGKSLVSLGKLVLEEHRIVHDLKEKNPETMQVVSSFRTNSSKPSDETVQKLSASLDEYVEHSPEMKKVALDILDKRGIAGLNMESEELRKYDLEHKIQKDLFDLKRGRHEVRDLDGGLVRNIGEYVQSLLKGEDIKSMIENQKVIEQMEQMEQI